MGSYIGDLQDARTEAAFDRAFDDWLDESYHTVVFVEGPDDILFWKTVASKQKQSGCLEADFDDAQIGLLPCGGDNLCHWIDSGAVERITPRFGVVVDSDRKSPNHNIPGRKLNWKRTCEEAGGMFFILRKREIENYVHPDAIARMGAQPKPYDDFTDMKALFGPSISKAIREMTVQEILEQDSYEKDGVCHHELKEIIEAFLALPGGWP